MFAFVQSCMSFSFLFLDDKCGFGCITKVSSASTVVFFIYLFFKLQPLLYIFGPDIKFLCCCVAKKNGLGNTTWKTFCIDSWHF